MGSPLRKPRRTLLVRICLPPRTARCWGGRNSSLNDSISQSVRSSAHQQKTNRQRWIRAIDLCALTPCLVLLLCCLDELGEHDGTGPIIRHPRHISMFWQEKIALGLFYLQIHALIWLQCYQFYPK